MLRKLETGHASHKILFEEMYGLGVSVETRPGQ